MAATPSASEEAQLLQTIEMFEVITQSQPQDYQSLEILKEAYYKLGREQEVVGTSKRIAEAYVQMGQLSSAILEYETILQRFPDDPDVQAALSQIENKANNLAAEPSLSEPAALTKIDAMPNGKGKRLANSLPLGEIEDGRKAMHKILVEAKHISAGDFDLCWKTPDLSMPVKSVIEPFVQLLAEKDILPVEKTLKIISDKSRLGFLHLERYDIDIELARGFSAETCRRWCVLPFDKMSKSVLVATANPFNQQAARELSETMSHRIVWYLVPPDELVKTLRKTFR